MSHDVEAARAQLEAILGGRIGERVVPGTLAVAGREFLFVGCNADLSERELGDEFHKVLSASPFTPRDGSAALTENCTLTLPSGECFFGLSYKGDIEGWRRKAIEGARALGRRTATVEGGALTIDDGRRVSVKDCAVRFF